MVEPVAPFYLMITLGVSAPAIPAPSFVPQQTLTICEANIKELQQNFIQMNVNSAIFCIKGKE